MGPVRRSLRLALLLACITASSAFAAVDPALTVAAKSVTASSFRPGASIAFFSVGLGSDGYSALVKRTAVIVTDDDHDGSVTLDVPAGVPFRSFWAAVDTQTGQYAVAEPEGFILSEPRAPKRLRHSTSGNVDTIVSPGQEADVLYVAPGGGGVWIGRGSFSGVAEGERAVTLNLATFSEIAPGDGGHGKRPDRFTPGGVAVVVDYFDLSAAVVPVTPSLLSGAD